MDRILIVDDDDQLRQSFDRLLVDAGYDTLTAASGEAALAVLDTARPDLIIADVRLPGMSGLEMFTQIRKQHPKLPVIIMTAFGTTNSAIEATKLGAYDYVLKPFEIPDMLDLIGKALEAGRFMRSKVRLDHDPGRTTGEDVIIGRSKPMQELYKAIGRAAPTDATVLIRGESGTGKETGGPGRVPAQPPGGAALFSDQLRGHPGKPTGKRAVRLREGGLYRGRVPAHR